MSHHIVFTEGTPTPVDTPRGPRPLALAALKRQMTMLRMTADEIVLAVSQKTYTIGANVRALDADTFADAMEAMVAAGVPGTVIAQAAKVSSGAISRWSRGLASPHPIMRKRVVDMLPLIANAQADEICRQIDQVEKALELAA